MTATAHRDTCEVESGCKREVVALLCEDPNHPVDGDVPGHTPSDRCQATCDWHGSTDEYQAAHPEPPNTPEY